MVWIARSSFYSMSPLSMVPLSSISRRSKASSATFKKSSASLHIFSPSIFPKLIKSQHFKISRPCLCMNFQCFVNSLIHFFSDDKSSRSDNWSFFAFRRQLSHMWLFIKSPRLYSDKKRILPSTLSITVIIIFQIFNTNQQSTKNYFDFSCLTGSNYDCQAKKNSLIDSLSRAEVQRYTCVCPCYWETACMLGNSTQLCVNNL